MTAGGTGSAVMVSQDLQAILRANVPVNEEPGGFHIELLGDNK